MNAKAAKLAAEMGLTSEHPDFNHADWRDAVSRGDTLEGYWDWVILEMRYQQHPWLDDE